ncbi:MAG: hypothetical protein IKU82_05090, partial [Clostridia bacterium]|nr:hypothetical protein [Clostridia bacterium]
TILFVFLLVFAVLGITEFIYILSMMFYYPKTRTTSYAFIVLKNQYALKQLEFLWQKIKWQGDAFSVGIIAITDNIQQNELNKCFEFIVDKNIMLCTSSEIFKSGLLQGELSNGDY